MYKLKGTKESHFSPILQPHSFVAIFVSPNAPYIENRGLTPASILYGSAPGFKFKFYLFPSHVQNAIKYKYAILIMSNSGLIGHYYTVTAIHK